ncbi:RHS repeat-associated core domain-containing protein [Plantactinospora sp. B6F1]|uniref:RHS repeat domain-containing protein n=1 Tax=Plantactinospora sp. B6F1 TaxID=3158971 RepID=UPI0032D97549
MTLLGQPPAGAVDQGWKPPVPRDVPGVEVTEHRPAAPRPAWSAESRAVRGARPVTWPQPGTATAFPASADRRRAGSLPVTVTRAPADVDRAPRAATAGAGAVAVTVFDRAVTNRANVSGLLLSLAPADAAGTGPLSVGVDYAGFADAYGGDWGSRLRLVRRPACVTTTPELPRCQGGTVLPTTNQATARRLSAELRLAADGPTVLAVEPGPSGDNGDYTASDLSAAGTWEVSTQTGAFTWSYELGMPPAPEGPEPSVSLEYSSSSLDGRTGNSNNQGGWVGDGWDSWPGFIERRYASCADDNPGHKTGDQCWFSDNATLSMNGRSGELIRSGNVWRLKDDDGTRIERLSEAARANGDNDNEFWKVTTTDGMQYFFGYHRLPNWTADKPVTNSTWTAPVYGNNANEPCNKSTFAASRCDQAWRWNLDYVVDPNQNTLAYYYGKETGAYGRDNTPSQRTTYDRGGWLDRIEYGTRYGTEYSAAAPLRVLFSTAERCLAGCWTGTPWQSDPVRSAWPDTPWDQYCKASPCNEQTVATFWSSRRLTKVTAQLRNGTSTYRDVESWTLRQEFVNAGTGESTPMWLRGLLRKGHVTTAGGAEAQDPEITFDPGAEPLPNRVDALDDQRTELNRWRIKAIRTESGGDILVSYAGGDCTRSKAPKPESNTTRCMPSYYAWPGSGDPTLDWFHKYVVTRVDLDDIVTDQPTQSIFYDYLDTPAWAYNTDELTKDKYRTWGDWRGYGRVQVRKGDPTSGVRTATEYRYLRGMHGDKQPSGTRNVQVPDTWGGSITDHEALRGFLRQEITFDGAGGAEVSSKLFEPWRVGPTATRTRQSLVTNAWKVETATTRTRTALADGRFRTAKSTSTFNNDGLVTAVDDFGDENVTGDETCVRNRYARNETSWMIDRISQTETLTGTCAAAADPPAPSTVLKRNRTFYDVYRDESSFGAAPTKGNAVRTEDLERFAGSTPVYVRTETRSYDENSGRLTSQTDARGYTTRFEIVTAHGGLVTRRKEINPLGHTVTTTVEPAWDLPVRTVDANDRITDQRYDGLGRQIGVWLPGRDSATQSPSVRIGYQIRNAGGPSAVTTETLLVTGSSYRTSIELFDGFLRDRQTQTRATGGGRLLTDTFHNARGEVDWVSQPYYDTGNGAPSTTLGRPAGQIPAVTQTLYDGAGRQIVEILKAAGAEKWRTTTDYAGDRVHTVPPDGGTATTELKDVQDRTTELRQYRSRADVGSTDPARFEATKYTYTPLGQQETVRDPAGNLWSYRYDLRGREIVSVDPDRGESIATFDASGNQASSTVRLGSGTATIAYTYDELNRRTSARDDSATGALRAAWVYDTLPYGKGALTSATRYVDGAAWITRTDEFDNLGRPLATSVVVPASQPQLCASAAPDPCVYTTRTSYRANGKVHQTTLPQAADLPSERLTSGYTDVDGEGTLLSPQQIYVNKVTHDKLGQTISREFGAYESRLTVTAQIEEATGRLTEASAIPVGGDPIAKWSYSYQDSGNLKRIVEGVDAASQDVQCFGYDHLRRLDSAWTPRSGDCGPAPTVAGLGGLAPYWRSWSFDASGNRRTETRHGSTNTTFTYTHPAPGAARPHAVTRVTATGGSTEVRDYTYDTGGNTSTRPGVAGGTAELTWDREGRLQRVVDGGATTSYRYDSEGNRLTRSDSSGDTLYLPGGLEVRVDRSTGVRTATRYYTHDGETIAVRSGGKLSWIVSDHHGTAELTVDATTLAVARRRTLPYGELRGGASGVWAPGLDKGFVGGTVDPTGTTHLGAREYDPFLGRFISSDPLLETGNPVQMQGYAYANHSPTTESDPTGQIVLGDNEGKLKAYKPVGSKKYKIVDSRPKPKPKKKDSCKSLCKANNKIKPYKAAWNKFFTAPVSAAWKRYVSDPVAAARQGITNWLKQKWAKSAQRQSAIIGNFMSYAARMTGGQCEVRFGLHVCQQGWLPMKARGGTTYGTTFITDKHPKSVGPSLAQHEKVHRDKQWGTYGAAFGPIYLFHEWNDRYKWGQPCNRWEAQAEALSKGGGGYPGC